MNGSLAWYAQVLWFRCFVLGFPTHLDCSGTEQLRSSVEQGAEIVLFSIRDIRTSFLLWRSGVGVCKAEVGGSIAVGCAVVEEPKVLLGSLWAGACEKLSLGVAGEGAESHKQSLLCILCRVLTTEHMFSHVLTTAEVRKHSVTALFSANGSSPCHPQMSYLPRSKQGNGK